MTSILDRYLSVQTDDQLVAQRGRMLNLVLLITSGAVLFSASITIAFGPRVPIFLIIDALSLLTFGVLYWYTRCGHHWPPYLFLAFLALVMPYAFQKDLYSPLALALAAPVVMAPLIAAPWLSIPMAVVEALMLFVFNSVLDYPPLNPLAMIILGVFGLISWLSSSNLANALKEASQNASALAESNRELQSSRALLEINARDLERRAIQLEAAAAVGQAATSILETERLTRRVVEVIREQFGLYYVGLFLMDDAGSPDERGGEWAVLQAGTGEAGQAMLARGHRLRIDGGSMIGWSIAHSQVRIAQKVEEDAVHLPTPELPDTRSEAALPLRSRGQVLGALTVQSDQPAAFDQDAIVVLQTMADQVAVALDNARLFAEAKAALEATHRAYGELSREAWAELLRVQPGLGYSSGERGVTRIGGIRRTEMEQEMEKRATVQGDSSGTKAKHPLAVPLKVRGNVLGILDTYKPGDAGEWTPEEVTLVEALADQVGMALESARLYNDAQRRAIHERLVSEISDKLRRATDMDTLMQTAIREMAAALDAPSTFVQLSALPETARDED
jgi:GAF domain-containing protein